MKLQVSILSGEHQLDAVVAVFAKRKSSKNSTNLLAGEQGRYTVHPIGYTV